MALISCIKIFSIGGSIQCDKKDSIQKGKLYWEIGKIMKQKKERKEGKR